MPEEEEIPLDPKDPSFFDLILETDLANIVKKSQAGQPLNKREREMIEAERSRVKGVAAPAELELETEGPLNALEKMTQKELAAEWDVSLRTIKGWLSENDPAPLTKPAQFPAWFARVHAPRECPERYRNSAQRILAGLRKSAEVPEPPAKSVEKIEIPDSAKGLLAMLERFRDTEARLGNDYQAAVDSGDEVKASFLFAQWTKTCGELRAQEKIAPKILEELGIYVRKDEIARELEPLHRAIIKSFRQKLRMSRPRLRAATTAEEWNQLTDEIVEEAAQMLVDTDFVEPLELEAA